MGILKVNLSDVKEPTIIEANTEVTLRIISVKEGVDKNGNNYIQPVFEVPEVPEAKSFSYFLSIPNDQMDAKKKQNSGWRLLQFLTAFGVNSDGEIDLEDLIGLTADAILGVESSEQYGDQNYVKRFVAVA